VNDALTLSRPLKGAIDGNESVAPPIILKIMLLLIFYNVHSERELVATIPERLDWLWFLDYDLEDNIPNHRRVHGDGHVFMHLY
jgi:transposase